MSVNHNRFGSPFSQRNQPQIPDDNVWAPGGLSTPQPSPLKYRRQHHHLSERWSRLALFFLDTVLLFAGGVLTIFGFVALANSKGLASTAGLYPTPLLISVLVLGFYILATGVLGCAAGFQMRVNLLIYYAACLVLLIGLQTGLGFVAHVRELNANSDAWTIVNTTDITQRAAIEQLFSCNVTFPPGPQGPTIYEKDGNFTTNCYDSVSAYLHSASTSTTYSLWGGLALVVGCIAVCICTIIAIRGKEVREAERQEQEEEADRWDRKNGGGRSFVTEPPEILPPSFRSDTPNPREK